MQYLLVLALVACGCGATSVRPRPTTGGIAGLARDLDSGDPIAKAEIRVRAGGQLQPRVTVSSDRGLFDVQELPPGDYTLTAHFAGQPLEVNHIAIRAGEITMVDLVFTLGRPTPITIDHRMIKGTEIERYHPTHLTSSVALIEGTVTDTATRQRVAGAVVTAVRGETGTTEQTVADDQGRFRFDAVPPGVYSISAYYTISGRGQIEVRRSGVTVDGAEAVMVPLWIDMQR